MFGSHPIKEAAHGSLAWVGTSSNPEDRDADHRSADHRQIKRRGAVADAAAVFSGGHIQAQMQPGFDTPMASVGLQHFRGAQGSTGARTEQIFSFDLLGRLLLTVEGAGEPGCLLHEGETDGLGPCVERDQAARLGAAAIEFAGLDGVRFDFRGKRRATDFGRVVARFGRRLSDCL